MIVMPPVFNAGDTIYFFFDSYGSSGESITITGLAVTDIEVYKNGSTTQRASDNGYALLDTDGIDFDGTTGLHGFSIDTSDNSDAGFWVDGGQYLVNVNAITVNTQTVRFSYMLTLGYLLRPATVGRKLGVSAGGAGDANVVSSLGVAVTNEDLTIASATATTITLPTTYSSGDTLPDSDQFTYHEFHVVAGTGVGQFVRTTTAAAGARTYNVLSGTMIVQLDNTSKVEILGTWDANTTHFNGIAGTFIGGVPVVALDQDQVITLTPTAGTVGNALSQSDVNLNAAVSTRATQVSVDDLPTNAELATALDPLPTANENADALLDRSNGIETGLTPRNALRLIAAASAGEVSGAATTTVVIRNAVADSKDRITATVDADGNRTAITTDLT